MSMEDRNPARRKSNIHKEDGTHADTSDRQTQIREVETKSEPSEEASVI
jgi:hypothetical protein